MWEDPANAQGCELRIMLQSAGQEKLTFTLLDKIWSDLVFDLVSGRIPNVSDITGIRICDKSRNDLMVRVEIWLKFPNGDKDPKGVAIKEFITKEYLEEKHLKYHAAGDVL